MGAKARVWLNRSALLLGILVGLDLLWTSQASLAIRVAVTVVGAVLGALVAFRLVPAFDPWGRVRWRLPSSPADRVRADPPRNRATKRCALTFDDGPSHATPEILDRLAAAGVKATFFVLTANVERHPAVARRLVKEGHVIALHGRTHRKLHRASVAEIDNEISSGLSDLKRMGLVSAPLYRPPHGLKNRSVFSVSKGQGLNLWAWSRGIWDTDRTTPAVLVKRATRLARDGMVLLLHDGRGDEERPDVSTLAKALPDIIDGLKQRGFHFVTLDTTSPA